MWWDAMFSNNKIIKVFLFFVFIFIIVISAIALSGLNDINTPLVKVLSYDENGNVYRESYGSITKMDDKYIIITDYYVVEEVKSAEVMISENSRIDASVIKDPRTQTAILIPKSQTTIDELNSLYIGNSSTLVSGEELYIHNEDGTKDLGIMENIIPSFSKYYSPTMITNFKNHIFERGKPVLNYRNEIVGIMTFYQRDRIIIPIDTYKKVYYSYMKDGDIPLTKPSGDLAIETGIPINFYPESEAGGYVGKDLVNIKSIYSKNQNIFFGNIQKIQFGLEESIYVLDSLYNRIYKFDKDYNFLYSDRKNENMRPLLENPVSFSVTPAGLVYVLDNMTNSTIKLFNRELELIKEVNLGDEFSNMDNSSNIYINDKLPNFDIEAGDERVYILGKNIILIFDEKLNMLKVIGGNGIGEDRFMNASDITILEDDSFAVLDQKGAIVKLFDRNGNFKLEFPIHAPVANSLSTFRGDHIVVVDKSNSKIKLFDNMGHFIRLYQVNPYSPYGVPKGLIFDDNENLHIYYENQSYIIVYSNTGTQLKIISSFTYDMTEEDIDNISPATNLYTIYSPKHLAVTPNNIILVDHKNYLHIFNRFLKEESNGEELEDYPINEIQRKNIISSKPYLPPIDYRFNISGIEADDESDVVYLSESNRGKLYKYDVTSGEFVEILIKIKYLAHDFIPILAHFDGEYLYTIDKMNDRIIVSTTEGVVKEIEKITVENQPGNLPILDITTMNTARGKEIIILTKIMDKYSIHNYDSNWRRISSKPHIEIDKDFLLGRPIGLDVYQDTLFIVEPYEYHMMTYELVNNVENPTLTISSEVDISFLNEPSGVLVKNGKIFILDTGNNRVVEYDIMLNNTAINNK